MDRSSVADVPHLFKLLWWGYMGREVGFSFNVAERCPINCACYWRERVDRMAAEGEPVEELEDDAVVVFFERMKADGYQLATLVGGEPYVRPALLERVTPIMPANWLVTSGTSRLRRFPKTTHFISIDGADAETHNTVRRSKMLFERILRNLEKIRAEGDFPAFGHTVLNSANYQQIEGILDFWSGNELLDGFAFSTMTPIRDSGDDELRLSREQREWLVRELVRQKERYGGYVLNTPNMIEMFHPDVAAKQTPETCGTATLIGSFDGAGNRIKQCIVGENADCSQCGCVITTMVETLYRKPPQLATIRMLEKLRTR